MFSTKVALTQHGADVLYKQKSTVANMTLIYATQVYDGGRGRGRGYSRPRLRPRPPRPPPPQTLLGMALNNFFSQCYEIAGKDLGIARFLWKKASHLESASDQELFQSFVNHWVAGQPDGWLEGGPTTNDPIDVAVKSVQTAKKEYYSEQQPLTQIQRLEQQLRVAQETLQQARELTTTATGDDIAGAEEMVNRALDNFNTLNEELQWVKRRNEADAKQFRQQMTDFVDGFELSSLEQVLSTDLQYFLNVIVPLFDSETSFITALQQTLVRDDFAISTDRLGLSENEAIAEVLLDFSREQLRELAEKLVRIARTIRPLGPSPPSESIGHILEKSEFIRTLETRAAERKTARRTGEQLKGKQFTSVPEFKDYFLKKYLPQPEWRNGEQILTEIIAAKSGGNDLTVDKANRISLDVEASVVECVKFFQEAQRLNADDTDFEKLKGAEADITTRATSKGVPLRFPAVFIAVAAKLKPRGGLLHAVHDYLPRVMDQKKGSPTKELVVEQLFMAHIRDLTKALQQIDAAPKAGPETPPDLGVAIEITEQLLARAAASITSRRQLTAST